MRSMLSDTTTWMPAIRSAYGLCSRLDPLPRRFPATEHANPPAFTLPRSTGASSVPSVPAGPGVRARKPR